MANPYKLQSGNSFGEDIPTGIPLVCVGVSVFQISCVSSSELKSEKLQFSDNHGYLLVSYSSS